MVKASSKTPPRGGIVAEPAEKAITTIRLSEIFEAGTRLEAAAFNVIARKAVAALRDSSLPLVPLYGEGGLCSEATNAFRFKRIYVGPDRGVPFLSSSEIIALRPEAEHYLSTKHTAFLDELAIRKWDVLISCSGTVGNVGLASDSFVGKALSQHAIRLRHSDAEGAGYVAAFLRSRFGRPQLTQASYGSVVVHIEPSHLKRVLIPNLPAIRRIAIGSLMCRAADWRHKANELLAEADRLLQAQLGLPALSQLDGGVRASSVRASQLTGRFDGSYHAPQARSAEAKVRSLAMPVANMGTPEVCAEIRPITKFRERTYVERGGIPLYSSKQLFQVDPIDVKRLAKGAHTKDLPEIQLEENMIAVTRSGTIGRVQIIPKYMAGWTASEHATRILAAPDMNPGYLYAWLASDYGYRLITRHSYGSVILEIDKDMLASIPVPLPGAAVQNEIGDLVLKASRLRSEACQAEREAISQFESLIGGPA